MPELLSVGEAMGACVDVKVLDVASESVLRRCEGPGRGESLCVVGAGKEMSTQGAVVEAQG